MNLLIWIKAFRLRTLPLSMSGIILGSFIAKKEGFWDFQIFFFALLTTLLFQILSNLANDLGDFKKGTDNENRVGPIRTVQSGAISPKSMKFAVILLSFFALLSAFYLIKISSKGMTINTIYMYAFLAFLAVLSAITYTIGKKAYGYSGFGDVFVFIFFGLVAVIGSYGLFTKHFSWYLIYPACTIGFLSTAVLNLNNMRDRINDAASGKITVVVKLGGDKSKFYHLALLFFSFLSYFQFIKEDTYKIVFVLPFIFFALHARKVMGVQDLKEFDPELKKVALTTFLIAVLYAVISSLPF